MSQFNKINCFDNPIHASILQSAIPLVDNKPENELERNTSIDAIDSNSLTEASKQKSPCSGSFAFSRSDEFPMLTESASKVRLNSDIEFSQKGLSINSKFPNTSEFKFSEANHLNSEMYLRIRSHENLSSINSNNLKPDLSKVRFYSQSSCDNRKSISFGPLERLEIPALNVNSSTENCRLAERTASFNLYRQEANPRQITNNTEESQMNNNNCMLRTEASDAFSHRKMSSSSNIDIIYQVNSLNSSYQSLSESRLPLDENPIYVYPASNTRAEIRKLIIEELISFEETYISSLKILVNVYLGTVDTCGDNATRTVSVLKKDAESLIEYHQDLLNDIRLAYPSTKIFRPESSNENHFHESGTWSSLKDINTTTDGAGSITSDYRWNKPILTASSPSVAKAISELVAKKAIVGAVYEQYCINYDTIMSLLKMFSGSEEYLERTWSKGSENIVNATRSKFKHTDLSLDSLAITPIARISKYKLLLKALLDNTTEDDDCSAHESIALSLEKVEKQLLELNSCGLVQQPQEKSQYLWRHLTFEKNESFRSQGLGNPILCGGLSTTWIEKHGVVKQKYMGCFLFKSYLLLADVGCREKYLTQFMIPLKCAKLFEGTYNEHNGSMVCQYNHSFKLIFEHEFGLSELLFIATSYKETVLWKEMIEVQIIHNTDDEEGLSLCTKSHENAVSSAIIPANTRIMTGSSGNEKHKVVSQFSSNVPRNNILGSFRRNQLHIDNNDNDENIKYMIHINHFSHLSDGEIREEPDTQSRVSEVEHRGKEHENIPKSSKKRKQNETLNRSEGPHRKFVINIRRSARIKIEKTLAFVWSFPDIPLIRQNFIETEGFAKKLARHTTYLRSTLSSGSTNKGKFRPAISSPALCSSVWDGPATWSHGTRGSNDKHNRESFDKCKKVRTLTSQEELPASELASVYGHNPEKKSFNTTKLLDTNFTDEENRFDTDQMSKVASNKDSNDVDTISFSNSQIHDKKSLKCQDLKAPSSKEPILYGSIKYCVSRMVVRFSRKQEKV